MELFALRMNLKPLRDLQPPLHREKNAKSVKRIAQHVMTRTASARCAIKASIFPIKNANRRVHLVSTKMSNYDPVLSHAQS